MPNRSSASAVLERRIPKSSEPLPAVGLGTWQAFDVGGDGRGMAEAKEALRVFVAEGGRVIDTSPMYGSAESVTGQLATELRVSAKLFVATKVWTTGKQAGVRQMEESMRRLRVQRLDLMQVHNLVDVQTQLATLRDWKTSGRFRYIGVTHYHAGGHAELEKIIGRGDVDFVQVNYSLAEPEADRRLLRAAADSGTAGLGAGDRERELGAILSQVDPRPARRHLRDPRDPQRQARGGESRRSLRSPPRRGDAPPHARVLHLALGPSEGASSPFRPPRGFGGAGKARARSANIQAATAAAAAGAGDSRSSARRCRCAGTATRGRAVRRDREIS